MKDKEFPLKLKVQNQFQKKTIHMKVIITIIESVESHLVLEQRLVFQIMKHIIPNGHQHTIENVTNST